MYTREIPIENRAEIKEIMSRMTMLPARPDLERLFYLYYRYVKVISKNENAQKRMQNDLNCGSCRGKVIMYFRNIVDQW
jgi:hypothetical protein